MVFCSGFFVGLFIWVVSGFILFVSFVFLSIALIQSYLFLIEVSSAQPQSSQNIVFTNIPSNFQVNFNYRQNSRIILDRVVFFFFSNGWRQQLIVHLMALHISGILSYLWLVFQIFLKKHNHLDFAWMLHVYVSTWKEMRLPLWSS